MDIFSYKAMVSELPSFKGKAFDVSNTQISFFLSILIGNSHHRIIQNGEMAIHPISQSLYIKGPFRDNLDPRGDNM